MSIDKLKFIFEKSLSFDTMGMRRISAGAEGATPMSVCERCGKQGLFVRISKWNLCSSCRKEIEALSEERIRLCVANLKAMESSASGEMRVRYLDRAAAAISELLPYDAFDPPVATPRPSERLQEIARMKESLASEQTSIETLLDRADEILSTLSTPLGSETRIRYALSLLDEAIQHARGGDANTLERAYRTRSRVFEQLAAIDRSAAGIQSGLAFTRSGRRHPQERASVSSADASTGGSTPNE